MQIWHLRPIDKMVMQLLGEPIIWISYVRRAWNLAVHRQSVIATLTTLAILALLVQKVGTRLLYAGNTFVDAGLEENRH